jgi:class 3 adenylate cyclase
VSRCLASVSHDAAEVLRASFVMQLVGDRRHVTTLFADIRGYTALAAQHEPEEALDLLNGCLEVTSDAVEEYAGTAADLLGDGVFSFFGAPFMHADDPPRAVRAALAIQSGIRRVDIQSLSGVRLHAGVGITPGEVIAGNVGSVRRMHCAVVGDAVNVAARLQANGHGEILVDAPTHAAVHGSVVSQDMGDVRLGGRTPGFRSSASWASEPDSGRPLPAPRPDHAQPGVRISTSGGRLPPPGWSRVRRRRHRRTRRSGDVWDWCVVCAVSAR